MDKKIGQRPGGQSSQVKRPRNPNQAQRSGRAGRASHAQRAGHKGSVNEHAGEEFEHHDDLHDQEERRQESWQIQRTVQGQHDRDDRDGNEGKNSRAQQQMLARRQALRQQGNLLTQKNQKNKPKKELPQVAATKRDGFERVTQKKLAQLKKTEQAKLETPLGPRIPPQQMTVAPHYLLKDVRDAGEFFEQLDPDGQGGQGSADEGAPEEIDPEWLAAVRETGRLLQGVRGITAVTRGLTDADEPCVLVMTALGLTAATFDNVIPAVVRGYPTLVAIPFDALPLRRERPLPTLSINP